MTFLVVLGIYCAILFFIAFFSRRLVAVASLTLCAGAVLAKLWSNDLTPLVAQAGVHIIAPPLGSLIAVALTIIPALFVLIKSPREHKKHHRTVSSLVFAVLGVMLTYGAFSNAVMLDTNSQAIVMQIIAYERWILTGCIALALGEVLMFHAPAQHAERHKH